MPDSDSCTCALRVDAQEPWAPCPACQARSAKKLHADELALLEAREDAESRLSRQDREHLLRVLVDQARFQRGEYSVASHRPEHMPSALVCNSLAEASLLATTLARENPSRFVAIYAIGDRSVRFVQFFGVL
jgi:hypothetical protein